MRVIVTGANGFIGQHCVKSLANAGHDVYAFCLKEPDNRIESVKYVILDLRDTESVNRYMKEISATHLLHLAWYVNPIDYMSSLQNIEWLNISTKLLETFVNNGGKRVVTAGTCAEYDWSLLDEYEKKIIEDFPKNNGTTLYPVCKLALGNIFAAYMKYNNLSAVHGRIFYLFGPGENDSRLVSSAIKSFTIGKEIILRNTGYVRDYMYVKDVADAFTRLIESDVIGAVNIASGVGINLFNLLKCVEKTFARVEGLVKTEASGDMPNPPLEITADVSKLKSIGWSPKYSIEEALIDYKMYI